MPRWFAIVLLLSSALLAADTPLLPSRFAGWEKDPASAKSSADPAVADPANASVLREFGFAAFESASYTRPGRTLKLKAIRLRDHSSAYGAFVFYKTPAMMTEQIGDQASYDSTPGKSQVLFYRGNLLIDAQFDRVTAMSAAELRELSDALPVPRDEVAKGQPPVIDYFPRQSYVKNSVKYVLGPAGLQASGAPVGADLVDFSKSPELATGRYSSSAGQATLTLIYYPTPQIAADRLRAIERALDPTPGARTEQENFVAKRTGPLVALVTGSIPTGEAKSLLASISYDADVTWNEATRLSPRDNPIGLLWGAIQLSGILVAIMLALGLLFGGAKFAIRRLWPQYVHDSGEMIRLDLDPATSTLLEGTRPELPPGPSK